jgi:hypothetical protein
MSNIPEYSKSPITEALIDLKVKPRDSMEGEGAVEVDTPTSYKHVPFVRTGTIRVCYGSPRELPPRRFQVEDSEE